MARMAFTVGGAAVGGYFGGPMGASMGAMAGGMIGSWIDPPDDVVQEGSRVNNQATTASAYGIMRPWGYGTYMVSGNIIDGSDRRIIQHEDKQSSGGKGGGPSVVTTWETAERDLAVGLGVGEIDGILKIYANEELIWDATTTSSVRSPMWLAITIYHGTEDQEPDPTLESIHGVGNVPAYRGEAYVMFRSYQLGTSGNEPTFRFLVVRNGTPGTAQEILTHPELLWEGGRLLYDDKKGVIHFTAAEGLGGSPDADVLGYIYEPYSKARIATYPYPNGATSLQGSYSHALLSLPVNVEGVETNLGANAHLIVQSRTFDTRQWALYDATTGEQISTITDPIFSGTGPYRFLVPDVTKGLLYGVDRTTGKEELQWTVMSLLAGQWAYTTPVEVPRPLPEVDDADWEWREETAEGTGSSGDGRLGLIGEDETEATSKYYLCTIGQNDYRYFNKYKEITDFDATDGPRKVIWDSIQEYWWMYGRNPGGGPATTRYVAYTVDLVKVHDFTIVGDHFTVVDHVCYDPITRIIYHYDVSTTNLYEIDTIAAELKRTTTGWSGSQSSVLSDTQMCYHPGTRTVWRKAGEDIVLKKLDRLSEDTTYLSDVIADICDKAGMPATRYNTTACSSITVEGYPIDTGGSYRSKLLPLLHAYLVYGVDKETYIDFLPYSTDVVGEIPERDLGASTGDEPRPLVDIERLYEDELPYKVEVTYYNKLTDYEQGTQPATRKTSIVNDGKMSYVFPLVLTDDEAAALADVKLHLAHVSRLRFRANLLSNWRWLAGADLIRVTDDAGVGYIIRIMRKKFVEGVVEIEAERFDPSVLTSFLSGGAAPGRTTVVNDVPRMLPYYIDGPLLREQDDDAGFYWAATAHSDAFRGGSVYEQNAAGDWALVRSIFSRSRIGYLVGEMPAPANHNLWDVNTSITVRMLSGELESAPASTVLKGANLLLIGGDQRWEAVRFADKALVSATTYSVTNFLRGRLGTEHAMDQHLPGDAVIFATESDLRYFPDVLANLAQDRIFRAASFGTDLYGYDTTDTKFVNRGVCLEPYAPAGFQGDKHPFTLDIVLSWKERSRYPTKDAWTGFSSEPSTQFSLDVKDADGSVRGTYTTTGTEFTYARTSQTADGFDTLAEIGTFEIFQVSESVGRGYAAVISGYNLGPDGRPAYEVFAIDTLGAKFYFPFNEANVSNDVDAINAVTNSSTMNYYDRGFTGIFDSRATGLISSNNPDLSIRVSAKGGAQTFSQSFLGNSSVGTIATLFCKEGTNPGPWATLGLVRDFQGADTNAFHLFVNSAGSFRVYAASAGTSGVYATATTTVVVGQTYHLAGSVGASGIKAYVNGKLERTRTDGVKSWRGGQCNFIWAHRFNITDEIAKSRHQGLAFFDKQLTDVQVSALNQKRWANE